METKCACGLLSMAVRCLTNTAVLAGFWFALIAATYGQALEWSPYRQSAPTEEPTFSLDEPALAATTDKAEVKADVGNLVPDSTESRFIHHDVSLPRISTKVDEQPAISRVVAESQSRPVSRLREHQLELPVPPVGMTSTNAAATALQLKNELQAMTQGEVPFGGGDLEHSGRSEEQVAQLIDWFLTPKDEGSHRAPTTTLNSQVDGVVVPPKPGASNSINESVQLFRRRILSEIAAEKAAASSSMANSSVPNSSTANSSVANSRAAFATNQLRPSETRKVVPFGTRNDRVEVKSRGGNISLVARDAPLKEILAMLAKSQKLNLIFQSTPPIPGPLTPVPGSQGDGSASSGADGQPSGNQPSGGGGFASRLINAGASAVTRTTAAPTPGVPGAAGVAGLNPIGLGGNINSNMTVTLEDVPLDTALDMILSVAGFTWTRSQGIILVTPTSANAQLPPNAQGRIMQVFELDFAVAEDLDSTIQGLLSPVGQSFATSSLFNDNRRSIESIVVEDMPRYVDRIAEYISQVDVPPRQVAIQAYILEVELGSNLRHGVNLEYLASLLDPGIRFGSTGFARTTPSQAFFLELDATRLDGLLDVLRTTVDAKTLASPRIIAVNGQESRLQVGEQLGFRITTTTQTSTLESVQFLNVGVVLAVTPRISRDGRVLLHVQPEVSSGQVNPDTGLPEEETAELQTDVLLDDGQGIVVGGLIKEDMNTGQTKIPGLGDVPYLGAFFENRAEARSRTEIIVALVPKVLPLDHDRQSLQDLDIERATTPLMHGSLVENARPYEPSLPDPLRKSVRKHQQRADWEDQRQAARYGYESPPRTDLRTSALRQASYDEAYAPRRDVAPHRTKQKNNPWQFLRRPRIWSHR